MLLNLPLERITNRYYWASYTKDDIWNLLYHDKINEKSGAGTVFLLIPNEIISIQIELSRLLRLDEGELSWAAAIKLLISSSGKRTMLKGFCRNDTTCSLYIIGSTHRIIIPSLSRSSKKNFNTHLIYLFFRVVIEEKF